MSEDLFTNRPRMKEYLNPEDLNTEACVELAATVLREQAIELAHAARRYASSPTKKNRQHLKVLRDWYKSPVFQALSCGLADGEKVAQDIIKDALRGRAAL